MKNFAPQWHALGREAELAAEQLATGVTVLGRATHAQKGLYTQAFFALSIGFERLGKLILVADHAIRNDGNWLTDKELRGNGHDVAALLEACEPIARLHVSEHKFGTRPNTPIHESIIKILTEFGKTTRYYNLSSLNHSATRNMREPIEAWWQDVGRVILQYHYTAAQQKKDKLRAEIFGALMADFSRVIHHDEAGNLIGDIKTLMTHAGATAIVQRYGRLYVMQLIRWLATILAELSFKGAYKHRIEALLGLEERFRIFGNDDKYLRGRKTWSIYRLGR
jgi:hypothetical protein